MYAVIKSGGHQYRVSNGDKIIVDSLMGSEGDKITISEVLMLSDEKASGFKVGAPTISGAKVSATILKQQKAPKVTIFKYKRRKNYKKTVGHRQPQTVIQINNITG